MTALPFPPTVGIANAWAILYLYDLSGKEIWRRQQEPGAWCIATVRINWFGHDAPHGVFVYGQGAGRPAVIYDGEGNIVDTFPIAYAPDLAPADQPADFYGLAADVWGDDRDEVLLFNARSACIYANARPSAIPTSVQRDALSGHVRIPRVRSMLKSMIRVRCTFARSTRITPTRAPIKDKSSERTTRINSNLHEFDQRR